MPDHILFLTTRCQNCAAPLSGPYCSACGQHDVDYNRSFWHIVEEALEGFLHFDGKFFKSARYIFTRPGFLTTEFIAGRRAQYTNPIRFYLFASFLFFAASVLMSGFSTPPAERNAAVPQTGTDVVGANVNVPETNRRSPESGLTRDSKLTPETHVDAALPNVAGRRSWLDDPLRIRFDSTDTASAKNVTDEFWHLLPEMLFFCVPLLALALKLIYLGSGRLYIEHLIFALHIQALAFLSFILIKAGGLLGSQAGKGVESAVGTILLLGMFCLIYCAYRRTYGQNRIRTASKLALTILAYGLILIFASVGLATASIFVVSRNA